MTNALAAIAGQTRYPQASVLASATPYAGHTGPRLLLRMLLVAWPSLPATKYAAKTLMNWSRKSAVSTGPSVRVPDPRDRQNVDAWSANTRTLYSETVPGAAA